MNTFLRRAVLVITAALGLYVGLWAAAAPRSFYDSFPGLGHLWVAVDGPYNEHLVRDVGSLYVALAAASLVAAACRRAEPGRVVGVAWLVFSVPHLGYHLAHLDGFDVVDAVGQVVSLSLTIVLVVPLLVPPRPRSGRLANERKNP
ncbi:hypothetical protein ASD11_09720 [Aeromicrobium sp. Root495]|uniref:hypothetical protein n=1 Tax=Aeromicrobium sp. Root495 TaxID=1736550 RepID=UPI0006FE5B42|nr:hypothetical protein [Aeromicrobium sp. Root495]KQY59798.1 hypothetical protein ASD11_09720 [Aeromicrobium sp. Root495]